jgi:uncharacterized repeat protein (TIGR01451 family)
MMRRDRSSQGSRRAARFVAAACAWIVLALPGQAAAQATLAFNKYYQSNTDPDANGQVTVGDTLTFLVRAHNIGAVTLTNVVVTDNRITPNSLTCPILSPGQVCDLYGTTVVTVADESAGAIVNTGSVTLDQLAPRSATINTAVIPRTTNFSIVKYFQGNTDPDANSQATVGDTLSYLVRVQNTGNQPLTNVVVSDPRLTPSSITCPTVNRFQVCDLTGTTLVTVADETAGVVTNTGSGTTNEIPGPRTATVQTAVIPRSTNFSVTKYYQSNNDPDGNGQVTVGDTLSYFIRMQNTGNQPLHNVVVTDPRLTPSSITCPTVNRNQVCDLSGTTLVVAADETAGVISNTASVTTTEIPGPRTATVNTTVVPLATAMTIEKYYQSLSDADGNSLISVGDTVGYLVRVRNTGNVLLHNVVVSDPRLTPNTLTCPTLNRFQVCDLTGNTLVTVADETAGAITNTASATSDEVPGPLTATISTQVTPRTTSMTLNKYYQANNDPDANGVDAGDTLTFLVRMQNTGTQTLTNVVVSDPDLSPATVTCPTVTRSAICDLNGTYVVTAGDQSAGVVSNTATATSSEVPGPLTSTANVQVAGAATTLSFSGFLSGNTDPDGNGQPSEGDTLTFVFQMQNTGTTTLTNVVVNAPGLTPNTNTCPSVTQFATCQVTGTYLVTAGDAAAGLVSFTGSVTSTEAPGPVQYTVNTQVLATTQSLVINTYYWSNTDPDANGQVTVGDTLTYRVLVQNNGTQPLTNVVVTNPSISPNSLTCPTVNYNGNCDLFGTHVVTVADAAAGSISSVGSVTTNELPGPFSSTVVTTVQPLDASQSFNKSLWTYTDADGNGQYTVGDTLTYRLFLQNTGNVPLTNVVVSDPLISPNSLTCPTVNAGTSCDLFGTYVITPADEAAGQISNTGTVTSSELPTLTSTVQIPVTQRSLGMTLNKTLWTYTDADGNGAITVGDTITYRVTMANTGSDPIHNVLVSDPLISPNSLACATVNAFGVCDLFGTYVVTPADETAGQIVNTGSATSTELPGPYTSTVYTTVAPRSLGMTVSKQFWTYADNDSNSAVTVGDVITFRVLMQNTGNTPLTNVVVSDPLITPNSLTCPTVNAFGTCDLFGTYTVTAGDAAAGHIANTGSATSTQIPGPATSSYDTVVRSLTPLMTLTKAVTATNDADFNGQVTPGDTLFYTIEMRNTGFVNLTNVVVSDPLVTPGSTTCATVGSNGQCILSGSYVVTAADASAGSVDNTASATSNEIGTPVTATLSTPVGVPTFTLSVVKQLTGNADGDASGTVTVGDVLTYTITASRAGTNDLTGVVVSDPLITPNTANCALVNAGSPCVLTGTYTVLAADASAGSIDNTASATSAENATPATATLSTPVVATTTSMGVVKALTANADGDGNGQVTAGDVLTFTITATNTGTAGLTNVVVSDPLVVPASTSCATLAAAASCILTGTYTVTAADASAGSIANTGSASANEIGTPVTHSISTPVATVTTAMSVAKALTANADGDANGQVTVGDVLTYTITATNTGTTTLTNVLVSDPLVTPSSASCATLASAATCVLTGTYTVTAADAGAGSIDNTASASASEIGTPVTAAISTPVATLTPSMSLAKSVSGNSDPDGNGQVTVGDVLTYHVIATNTGTVTLTNLVVTDTMLSPTSLTCPSVGPGAVCDFAGTYTVTAADASAGSIDNTGSAVATEIGTPVTATLSTPVVALVPAMTLAKSVAGNADGDASGTVSVGDVLTYSVTATNTGTANLTNVQVSDPLLTPSTTTCNLAPAQACTHTGTYTVTAADAATGSITNTASAVANEIATPVTTTLVTPVPPPVTTVATTLAIVSGDAQVLDIGTASAPMVVELTAAGSPLAGQTIAWTATGGTLSAASTTTDAAGRTSVTVTLAQAGAITVTADFAATPAYLASSASFTHNSNIASVPILTPAEETVAIALDDACAELQTLPTLTPEQQDLLEQCLALTQAAAVDPEAVAEAIEEMLPDVAQTQTQASQAASTAQFDNLNNRMIQVRNGQQGNAFGGLALVGSGGSMPLAGLQALLGEPEKDEAGAGFGRWGFFASGRIGRGEADPGRTTPAYDFDIEGLTAGVDYRKSDNLVLGVALGYTRQDTRLQHDQGSLDTRGWSLSGYATWYRGASWYIDSLVSHARNTYAHRRRIAYVLPLPDGSTYAVDQVARASSDGSDTTVSATFGRDFHKGSWTMGYYGRAIYSRLSFGAFTEEVDDDANGAGLALDVDSRNVTAFSTVFGARFDYAHSADWGVLMPHFDLEWQREHKGDPGAFRAVFASDPTASPIVILGEPMDKSYFRIGAGLSWLLPKGRSGFIYYDRMVGRDGMDQDNLTLGIRIEFK